MSGTVLSTLCSICHAEPPKYKCPACNARTCSVACIQKHKTRADCDGQRNPRAFIPVTELRTPAGIDRDFNFISSIERARQRAEREIIETRHLLHEKEIHPPRPIEQKQFEEVWHGDELRHVPVPLPRQNENINDVVGFDKYVRRRLRALDVEVIMMPRGMSRQKQNTTSWNRRTDTINWQIEWLIYDPQQAEQPLKIFYKSLEGTPLYQALSNTLDYHRACHSKDEFNQPPPSRRHKRKPVRIPPGSPVQDFTSSSWNSPSFTAQSSLLSNWSISTCLPAYPTSQQETLSQYQYFLAKPKAKQLIRLQPATCLSEVLRGRTVIEFPTIFAVSPGGDVSPPGYTILESESDGRAPRVLKNKKPEDDEEDGNSSGEEGQAEEAEAADYNPRKRRFDRMERGGRGGRGRGRGGGGGRGTYRDRDDARGGKRVRFDSRGRHKGETNNDGKIEAEPAVSDEEGEVQEDMNGMEIDEQAIKQVVEMDIGVMTGTAQPELQGTREKLTAGGLLVDYGSDSD